PQTLPCAVMVARARCGDGGPGAYVCGRPHMGIACLQQAVVAPEAAPLVLLPCQACGLCRVPRISTGACAEVAGVWPVCACRVDQASRGSVACMRCAGQKKDRRRLSRRTLKNGARGEIPAYHRPRLSVVHLPT